MSWTIVGVLLAGCSGGVPPCDSEVALSPVRENVASRHAGVEPEQLERITLLDASVLPSVEDAPEGSVRCSAVFALPPDDRPVEAVYWIQRGGFGGITVKIRRKRTGADRWETLS